MTRLPPGLISIEVITRNKEGETPHLHLLVVNILTQYFLSLFSDPTFGILPPL